MQVCVGSSCHVKGSQRIIELLEAAIDENGLRDKITLVGSFCSGKCNRVGVTVQVGNDIYSGITSDGFSAFFSERVLGRLKAERRLARD